MLVFSSDREKWEIKHPSQSLLSTLALSSLSQESSSLAVPEATEGTRSSPVGTLYMFPCLHVTVTSICLSWRSLISSPWLPQSLRTWEEESSRKKPNAPLFLR